MSSVYRKVSGGVTAPKGFVANAISAGIKNPEHDRLDLALIYSKLPSTAAGVFTTNRVKAAPVKVSQAYIKDGNIRAILMNSGNANACTGMNGLKDARTCVKAIGKSLGIKQTQVAVCSTGVIGFPMPMVRIEPKLAELSADLKRNKHTDVAKAIMTSDTRHKEIAVKLDINGVKVKIGACAKGAGMINPHMATMLCMVTTDAQITKETFNLFLGEAVDLSFNRITIDGDMSTNDTVIALANGGAGGKALRRGTKEAQKFQQALNYVLLQMATALVRDGERVTKFVTVNVRGAKSLSDAKKVAEAVGNSSLVKSSWNGNDPNWGRIIHAVGYAKAMVKEELIDIHIGGLPVCLGGMEAGTSMARARKKVAADAFTIDINLNLCEGEYTIYSSDLSPEYVDFNRSEYAYWKQAKKDGLTKQ